MRLVCLVFTLSLALPSPAAPADTTIAHFSKVNDSVYRGGRPEPADLRYLQQVAQAADSVSCLRGIADSKPDSHTAGHSSCRTQPHAFSDTNRACVR